MALTEYYKSPLTIYVVWHPNNKLGMQYGEAIYNSFCRDVNSPLSRGLGIPVQFRYQNGSGANVPIDIDVNESDRNAIILLVDEEMFGDGNWYNYVQGLLDKEQESNTRIYPVALSNYAFSLDESRLNKTQFIKLIEFFEKGDPDGFARSFIELRRRLLHDFSRFFYRMEKFAEADKKREDPPVKLFISHAKVDGEPVAIEFRDFINATSKLKTFFDVNDIADAEDFELAIKGGIANTAVVVFLSDQYSTREWCRIEVIVAKRNKSPLVVVNNIEKGERRGFPYLGNAPTIRFKDNNFHDIIDLTLFQVLNNLFLEEKLKKEDNLYKLSSSYHTIRLENAPELFNYIDIKRVQKEKEDTKPILVIYPDPPLGLEEVKVLNDFDDDIKFITPAFLHQII